MHAALHGRAGGRGGLGSAASPGPAPCACPSSAGGYLQSSDGEIWETGNKTGLWMFQLAHVHPGVGGSVVKHLCPQTDTKPGLGSTLGWDAPWLHQLHCGLT